MPKPTNNAPIFKDRVGGLSVSAWAESAVIQQRKPNDPEDPKGDWHTVAEIKGLRKSQLQKLGEICIEAASKMTEKPFKGDKAKKSSHEDDDE